MKFKVLYFFFTIVFLLFQCGCSHLCAQNVPEYEELSLEKYISAHDIQKKSLCILIDKSDYALYVLNNADTVKTFSVVFGGNPKDDKRMQGDKCTPEGHFQVRSFYPHDRWSKFIWINYPTKKSRQKHKKAKKQNQIPQEAKIGGEIGIHGVPEGRDNLIDQRINWTLGCISMKNKDVNELYSVVTKQTEIVIQK